MTTLPGYDENALLTKCQLSILLIILWGFLKTTLIINKVIKKNNINNNNNNNNNNINNNKQCDIFELLVMNWISFKKSHQVTFQLRESEVLLVVNSRH